MSEELKKIQREITSLRKNLEELRRLYSDCNHVKKLRRDLVRTRYD